VDKPQKMPSVTGIVDKFSTLALPQVDKLGIFPLLGLKSNLGAQQ
jgi:hypothetical protein